MFGVLMFIATTGRRWEMDLNNLLDMLGEMGQEHTDCNCNACREKRGEIKREWDDLRELRPNEREEVNSILALINEATVLKRKMEMKEKEIEFRKGLIWVKLGHELPPEKNHQIDFERGMIREEKITEVPR